MRLNAVMDEAATVLKQITGLQVFGWPAKLVTAPAGFVSYPAPVDFDKAYQRGEDEFTDLMLVLVTSKVTEKSARDTAAEWASGSGARSVKRAMEEHTWTTCDDLTVTSAEFGIETIGTTSYLAVIFKATVVGPGED